MDPDRNKRANEINDEINRLERHLFILEHPDIWCHINAGVKGRTRTGDINLHHDSLKDVIKKIVAESKAELTKLREEYKTL